MLPPQEALSSRGAELTPNHPTLGRCDEGKERCSPKRRERKAMKASKAMTQSKDTKAKDMFGRRVRATMDYWPFVREPLCGKFVASGGICAWISFAL